METMVSCKNNNLALSPLCCVRLLPIWVYGSLPHRREVSGLAARWPLVKCCGRPCSDVSSEITDKHVT